MIGLINTQIWKKIVVDSHDTLGVDTIAIIVQDPNIIIVDIEETTQSQTIVSYDTEEWALSLEFLLQQYWLN